MQTILLRWKTYSRFILLLCAIVVILALSSDSIYLKPVEVREPVTITQVAKGCAPSKIISLDNVNISVGSSWKLGHAYHCLGYPNIVTTINRVGILEVDKLVSHAIVLNYVWVLDQTDDLTCSTKVKKIEPFLVDKEGVVLFAAYILDCKEVKR